MSAIQTRLDALESLICNHCGFALGVHMWGSHGTGPFDGLVCPTEESLRQYERQMGVAEAARVRARLIPAAPPPQPA